MTERHQDPLELWVGTWTPQDQVEREERKAEEHGAKQDEQPPTASESAPTA